MPPREVLHGGEVGTSLRRQHLEVGRTWHSRGVRAADSNQVASGLRASRHIFDLDGIFFAKQVSLQRFSCDCVSTATH